MTCEDLDDLMEPLVSGDAAMTPEIRAHLDGCARCRTAYAVATRIEEMLARQPSPMLAESFTAQVMARVRRQWWRSEQYLDLAFNVLVTVGVLVVAVGLYGVLTLSGMSAVGGDLARMFLQGSLDLTTRAAPQLGTYVVALVLVMSGLAAWWWADQGLEF